MSVGSVVSFVLVVITAACSGTPEQGGETDGDGWRVYDDPSVVAAEIRLQAAAASEGGFDEVAAALEDGHLTDAEYRQAYLDVVACWERAGVQAELVELDTIHGLDYTTTAIAPDGVGEECREQGRFSDSSWGIQTNDTITPEAARLTSACLVREGMDPAGAETLTQFRAVGEWEVVRECFVEAAMAIVPDGEEVVIGF